MRRWSTIYADTQTGTYDTSPYSGLPKRWIFRTLRPYFAESLNDCRNIYIQHVKFNSEYHPLTAADYADDTLVVPWPDNYEPYAGLIRLDVCILNGFVKSDFSSSPPFFQLVSDNPYAVKSTKNG